jgi:hypothetical protein
MGYIVAGVIVVSGCSEAPQRLEAVDAFVSLDANRCDKAAPMSLPEECLVGGLAQLDVNGSWMLAGTRTLGNVAQPYTATKTLCRSGTGWCQCDDTSGTKYADDTWLYTAIEDLRYRSTQHVCVNAADGTLVYHAWEWQSQGGSQGTWTTDGVLTR